MTWYSGGGLILTQLVLGAFFTATGWRKVFHTDVHEQVFGLFTRLKVPRFIHWPLVLGELAGGLGLLTGVFWWWAAIGLIPIMLGAFVLDTLPEIRQKHPHDFTGWVSKVICNPEALLLLALVTLVMH